MRELNDEKMDAAVNAMLEMKRMADGIDAFFAPHLARAKAQADKIAAAAKACREADNEPPEAA